MAKTVNDVHVEDFRHLLLSPDETPWFRGKHFPQSPSLHSGSDPGLSLCTLSDCITPGINAQHGCRAGYSRLLLLLLLLPRKTSHFGQWLCGPPTHKNGKGIYKKKGGMVCNWSKPTVGMKLHVRCISLTSIIIFFSPFM